ncbi:IS3 family transposase [Herbidospora mongoliensis]|uniref:IS3 family transposase n=1 Tax=Herbidospora mongoliensis TaxID=688067 RepID=UPI00082AAE7D
MIAGEDLPVQVACRVLNVSEPGYFAWRNRPPSPRSLRHAWLTERIRQIHAASRGAYGSRCVHAELKLGSGPLVAYHTVEMLMQRQGIRGLPGNPRRPGEPAIELANVIFDYLEIFHKRQRRHSALGMRTPVEYEMLYPTRQPA